MKIRWNTLLNFLIMLALLVTVAGFQTTFWFQLFGHVPAPMLWLNLLVYVILYRKPGHAIIWIYAMGFILLAYTGMPLKMMWFSLLFLFTLVYLVKSRVFWSGSGYYTIMCTFSAIAYQIIYLAISWILEKNPASFEIVDRLVQIVLTPSFAFPLYWVLAKIDKLTQDEMLQESGGLEL